MSIFRITQSSSRLSLYSNSEHCVSKVQNTFKLFVRNSEGLCLILPNWIWRLSAVIWKKFIPKRSSLNEHFELRNFNTHNLSSFFVSYIKKWLRSNFISPAKIKNGDLIIEKSEIKNLAPSRSWNFIEVNYYHMGNFMAFAPIELFFFGTIW